MTSAPVHENAVFLEDITLHYAVAGEEDLTPVVLLHGLYDRWEVWTPVIDVLAQQSRVIAPDLRGHARSSHPESGYQFSDYARDVIGLLDHLGLERAPVVGHSLGALVALTLAAEYPDRITRVAVVDPPMEPNEDVRTWLGMLLEAKRGSEEEALATIREIDPFATEEDIQRETAWVRSTADGPFESLIAGSAAGAFDELYVLAGKIVCPVLVLQADPRSGGQLDIDAAERLLSRLSDGRLQMFAETGHMIQVERPDESAAVVGDFLGNP